MSYAIWDAKLTGRCQQKRKIDNNTWLIRQDDGSIAMKLHDTIIVTVQPDGVITLNSGGWRTPTTKDRIHNALRELGARNIGITQKNGIWLVFKYDNREFCAMFNDGMRVSPNGNLVGVGPDPAAQNKIVKLIRTYMKPVAQMMAEGKFPKPSNGDPWNFMMVSTDGELAMCSAAENRKWLVSYMKDKYYFGSLLLRAMEKKLGLKYGDTDTLRKMVSGELPRKEWRGFISMSPICLHCFACVMNGEKPESYIGGIGSRQLAGVLDEYLKYWFELSK